MNEYIYDGPVMEFGRCINARWVASTYAVSENKAKNNLMYRCKQDHGKLPNSKITLPGKITVVERRDL